jgi:hypothetical protein
VSGGRLVGRTRVDERGRESGPAVLPVVARPTDPSRRDPPLRVPDLPFLQRSAGNRVVTALVARQKDDEPGVMRPDGEYRISERRYRELIGTGTTRELRAAYE